MKYFIILEAVKNRRLLFLFVDLSDKLFGNDMMLLPRLSTMLEKFYNSLHVLLVLLNPRPANCDSLMELGQSSTFAIYPRFPEACVKRRSCCDPIYFGELLLVLSRRQLSCDHLPRFLFFCNYFCFAGIIVERINNCGENVSLPSPCPFSSANNPASAIEY